MRLYYFKDACSLADHIALRQAGIDFDLESVDLKSKVTSKGIDFNVVNSKGYVPALALDGGEIITENIAILDWIASQNPELGIDGTMGRTRLLEMLAYISTEIHKGFVRYVTSESEKEKGEARAQILLRLHWLAERVEGDYLFGDRPTVADFYLFVTLRWAMRLDIGVPEELAMLRTRLLGLRSVQEALEAENRPGLRRGTS